MVLYHVRVLYSFKKLACDDLRLEPNEELDVVHCKNSQWWLGRNSHGEEGFFPSSFVQVIKDYTHQEKMKTLE